jgi:hypothetical protein
MLLKRSVRNMELRQQTYRPTCEAAHLDVRWVTSMSGHTRSTKPGLLHPSTRSYPCHCALPARSYATLRPIRYLLEVLDWDRYKFGAGLEAPSPRDEFGTGKSTTSRPYLASGSISGRSGCKLRRSTRSPARSRSNMRDHRTTP